MFHKVMGQPMQSLVGYVITIYKKIVHWKTLENRLRFDKVMAMSLWLYFFGPPCMLESKSVGWKERKSWVLSAQRRWFREQEKMTVLRGVMYMMKSKRPRTEPRRTLQEDIYQEDKLFSLWHGSNKMTDMTWNSWKQSHGYQTRMRGGWSRCHGQ